MLYLFRKINLYDSNKEFYKFIVSLLKFKPKNPQIYIEAFTHRSFHRNGFKDSNNERLEFLGDAILDSVVAEFLFKEYPNKDEGFLTNMRSKIVNRNSLDEIAEKLGFENYLKKNISDNTPKKHFFGNALEALIGAIYVDRGYKHTRRFVVNEIIKPYINIKLLETTDNNFKSQILEICQKQKKEYHFDTTEVKTDDKKLSFESKLYIDNLLLGFGFGNTKKEAEQNASLDALSNNDF